MCIVFLLPTCAKPAAWLRSRLYNVGCAAEPHNCHTHVHCLAFVRQAEDMIGYHLIRVLVSQLELGSPRLKGTQRQMTNVRTVRILKAQKGSKSRMPTVDRARRAVLD